MCTFTELKSAEEHFKSIHSMRNHNEPAKFQPIHILQEDLCQNCKVQLSNDLTQFNCPEILCLKCIIKRMKYSTARDDMNMICNEFYEFKCPICGEFHELAVYEAMLIANLYGLYLKKY